ncbi:MAG: hypothetical protein RL769_656 [Pseudomonadota bacterium]|jgi:hypothetical protein
MLRIPFLEKTQNIPEINSEKILPKYLKPKIMLIDMPEEALKKLQDKGFNVSTGTFGSPYQIRKISEYFPLIGEASLSNYSEQEIVVIDFAQKIKTDLVDEKLKRDEVKYWGKSEKGVLDPRVKASFEIRELSDRILENGGVFVIFADQGYDIDVKKIDSNGHASLKNNLSIWNFLSELSSVKIAKDSGNEISISNAKHPLSSLLKKYIKKSTFECSLSSTGYYSERWVKLALNKYGQPVSLANCNGKSGSVIILPQINDKAEFISDLLTDFLPEISPHLFSDIQSSKWIHSEDYELPQIIELKNEKELAQKELEQKLLELDEKIQNVRNKNSWRHDLISETNDALVRAVKKALEFLGFSDVIDMDKKRELLKQKRREDLQIRDGGKTIVVDIKGISGLPSDEDIMQAQKHMSLLMKEANNPKDIYSLAIINHQRNFPPRERDEAPFRQEIIELSNEVSGLLTTWELFRLVRNFERFKWNASDVIPIFYNTGRIEIIPRNFHFLGSVVKVWKKNNAFGIKIEKGELLKDSRIAIEVPFPEEFYELQVTSIMINNKNVQSAESGDEVGISYNRDISEVKIGMRIFVIK